MPEIHGSFAYPGVESPVAISYSCTHGITPGLIIIRCNPQLNLPQQIGDILIEDGVNRVVIPGCRLNTIRSNWSGNGFEWTLELVDRRWKWRDIGIIEGWYNQPDPRGKYVPWTIRSPRELALLCLAAMQESKFLIDLPDGLSKADGEDYQRFLQAGELFPQTSTNPPVNWQPENPANALARLCDFFGRRVVYDVVTDTVIIAKVGQGAFLPTNYSISASGPSLKSPETPDGLMVVGSPTKYQSRFRLIPVGEDWNGEYRPIEQLSYCPSYTAQTMLMTITIQLPPNADRTDLNYVFRFTQARTIDNGGPITYTSTRNVANGDTAEDQLRKVANDLAANGLNADFNILVFADGHMTIEGKTPDDNFAVTCGFQRTTPDIPPTAKNTPEINRRARREGKSWAYSDLTFNDLQTPTDRLTVYQMRNLARKSIWRVFRITNVDPADETKFLTIPGYGQIQRANQIVPLPTKVDQIRPSAGDGNIQFAALNEAFVLNLYNGFSRDVPAQLFGRVSKFAAFSNDGYNFLSTDGTENTLKNQVLPITPSIDANFLIVTVGKPLYFNNVGDKEDPQLVLETGCHVRDFNTNALATYKATRLLVNGTPTGTGWKVYRHPDVQLNVTAVYNPEYSTIDIVELLEQDAVVRGEYYLNAHSLEYVLTDGQILDYNGIVPISLDGAINQVTWEIDGNGCRTKGCRNTLPPWMPSYPERRREENLDAMKADFFPKNDKGGGSFAISPGKVDGFFIG